MVATKRVLWCRRLQPDDLWGCVTKLMLRGDKHEFMLRRQNRMFDPRVDLNIHSILFSFSVQTQVYDSPRDLMDMFSHHFKICFCPSDDLSQRRFWGHFQISPGIPDPVCSTLSWQMSMELLLCIFNLSLIGRRPTCPKPQKSIVSFNDFKIKGELQFWHIFLEPQLQTKREKKRIWDLMCFNREL